jgi:hypothetical protein
MSVPVANSGLRAQDKSLYLGRLAGLAAAELSAKLGFGRH